MSTKKAKFAELISGDQPVLIDFFATWCGPCKMMPPILKEVKEKLGDQVRIIKIDVDKNPQIAQKYSIRGVPTLIMFKNGAPVWQEAGVQTAPAILKVVEKHR